MLPHLDDLDAQIFGLHLDLRAVSGHSAQRVEYQTVERVVGVAFEREAERLGNIVQRRAAADAPQAVRDLLDRRRGAR